MNNNIRKRIILINEILELNSYIINTPYSNNIDSVVAILMELRENYHIDPHKEYDIFMIILNKITDIIFDSEEYLKYSLLPGDTYYHIINDIIYKLKHTIFIINIYLDELNYVLTETDNEAEKELDNIMSNLDIN